MKEQISKETPMSEKEIEEKLAELEERMPIALEEANIVISENFRMGKEIDKIEAKQRKNLEFAKEAKSFARDLQELSNRFQLDEVPDSIKTLVNKYKKELGLAEVEMPEKDKLSFDEYVRAEELKSYIILKTSDFNVID